MRKIALLLLLPLFFSCNTPPEEDPQSWEEARPLHEIYQDYFLMGNIISPGDLNNTARFNYLKRHFNTLTAENHMKPDNIAPSAKGGPYRWDNADRIITAATAEGIKVVGHTLIWYSQTPGWLTTGNKAAVEENLEKYVTDVVTHFKGKLISWDVVNEAMRDGLSEGDAADWKNCLRPLKENGWAVIGPEYIEKAFLAARKADPDVKLYYNDYNLNNAAKARAAYNMVNDINKKYPNEGGRPLIDGIGMQSHHHLTTNPQTVENSINLFASLEVEVAISEMDIQAAGNNLPGGAVTWGDDAAQRQAAQYAAMFKIIKKHSDKISRVTFWGIDDGTSWRSSTHPTLLDKDYHLKPAFYAVMDPNRY